MDLLWYWTCSRMSWKFWERILAELSAAHHLVGGLAVMVRQDATEDDLQTASRRFWTIIQVNLGCRLPRLRML